MKKKYWNSLQKMMVVFLIACFTLSLAGCKGKSKKTATDNNGISTGTEENQGSTDSTTPSGDNATPTEAAQLSYTFNDYMPGSPDVWSPHEWETSDDSYILDQTTMGLYGFDLNDTRDGYVINPEMAALAPVDVTSEYAGKETYGVPADATSQYAFKVALNENACWEDGTPINADTYIYSMQQMLDPTMKNYRATLYTSGSTELANAYEYNHSGLPIYTPVAADGAYREVADGDMYFSLTQAIVFFADSAQAYYEAGYQASFADVDGNDLFAKYADGGDYIQLTEEAKKDLLTISANFGDPNPEAFKEWCFTYDGISEQVPWENVGLIKTGDYEITIILKNPITEFYFYYGFSSPWLVYKDIYEANKKQTGDLIKTTYGTSVDSYMSFGPYKLTEYQVDKQITMVKNDKWYGYTDGKHDGQYQTTTISCQIVEAQATSLQLFLQGELDFVALVADDMESYRASDYIVFTPQTYTSKLTFNGDYKALKKRESDGINKTLLSYVDFRKALSISIDRTEFAAQCTATHKAGYGILNYIYVSNPDTGEVYRNTEQAKQVLCDFYGVSSEDQITGYNKEEAAKLMTKAYEDALANGDIDADDVVDLEFLVYKNDDSYIKIIKFIQEAYLAAAVGTPLEGRIHITMTADEDYYDHAQQGAFEIIISTWGGASMDPYGIMECYASPDKMFEYGFKPMEAELTIALNGESITKTFYDWYDALCNKEYAVADYTTRNTILAAMEGFILEQNFCTPLYYRTEAALYSKQVTLGTDTYVQILQFGGIRYMTYNYDDDAWKTYCSDNNNQLTY